MICKKCGAQIKPGAKFCTHCGADVEKEPLVLTCPECGRKVSADQKFCRFCGCTLDFSPEEPTDIPEIPSIPVPEEKPGSFFESEVKAKAEMPKEEKKKPEVKLPEKNRWPAYISLAAAGIGFLSPVRWIVSFVVNLIFRIFHLYYFYPMIRFLSFMYGFMHLVCIVLCLAIIGGLIYLISIQEKKDQGPVLFAFIPAVCSLLAIFCTLGHQSVLSFIISIPAILSGLLLANKVFIRRETLRGEFDLNKELDSLKKQFSSNKPKSAPVTPKAQKRDTVPVVVNERLNEESYFDGNGMELFVISIINALAVSCTCGLMLPWAQVRMEKYEKSHTVYNGRRLQFVGQTMDLFILFLKWYALSVITCGIFVPFAMVEYMRWVQRYTGYEGETPGLNGFEGSDFDGNAFEYYGYTNLGGALVALSCGLASGWYFNILRFWTMRHTKICHDRMKYEKDTWTNTLGVLLINYLLIFITCGIYSSWARCRINAYAVERTHIDPNYHYHES